MSLRNWEFLPRAHRSRCVRAARCVGPVKSELLEQRMLLATQPLFSATAPVSDAPPAAPSGLVATTRAGWAVLLAFTDNSTDEDQFIIEGKAVRGDGTLTNAAEFGRVAGSPAGETGGRFTFWWWAPTFPIVYDIRAVNAAGVSEPSNDVRVQARQMLYWGMGAEFFN